MIRARRAILSYPDALFVVELRHVPGQDWYLDETGEMHQHEDDAQASAQKYVDDWPEVKADSGETYELETRVVEYRRHCWSAPFKVHAAAKPGESE